MSSLPSKSVVKAAIAGAVVATSFLSAPGCQPQRGAEPSQPRPSVNARNPTKVAVDPASRPFQPIVDPYLPNAHQVTEKVIAGAQPEGEEGFERLRQLGVKTIISVDGAAPDLEAAKKRGMRYVHLPIEYSGVTEEQGKAIAKAIGELPGPIYLHCHHGMHRSAAAVAVACVMNGSLPADRSESVLKTFGTGANYKGLWKAAKEAKLLEPGALRNLDVTFVEKAKIPALADAMVAIDGPWDRLKELQKSGWKAPQEDPDVDASHQAVILQEHLREASRLPAVKERSEDFRKLLGESEVAAGSLAESVRAKPVNEVAADGAFKRLGASCAACHKSYRD
jgi:protein tyrosine phosphatase (PTP) superfamily phosphohydrolase (DUF442 family)